MGMYRLSRRWTNDAKTFIPYPITSQMLCRNQNFYLLLPAAKCYLICLNPHLSVVPTIIFLHGSLLILSNKILTVLKSLTNRPHQSENNSNHQYEGVIS